LNYRLDLARTFAHAETYNFSEFDDIVVHQQKLTDGLGADVRPSQRESLAPA
jgi:threonine dehydrogenase-like Zn-dependent dehydrogenase